MYLALIGTIAFVASLLTFFSGFGLGTLLSPVLALFFPLQLAIAATAIVHFLNNCFKLALMFRHISWKVFIRFSIPAGFAAIIGAYLLIFLGELPELFNYEIYSKEFSVTPIKLVIGIIFIAFSFSEFSKKLKGLSISEKYLGLGGLISGFFGGLSGNQGAFRSAFLLKSGLDKKQFVATGVISACVVDFVRISVYFLLMKQVSYEFSDELIMATFIATFFAFGGAIVGRFYLEKITMRGIQISVSILMLVIGVGLVIGLI
ncbi:MAG: sulfite exporter TauE/SafE family protein [Kangiellaceae bacterium]|nr:sulfite exporter TauE/SafE family protein [Kangiellaceae bacterium]MCW8998771.1 sulfite exporter TauE/SafE family protein [Kangiellaceae bacterium]MCW9017286.1 sulfite exporter TauE/SafE family protein [Kangiellaceae bacterium]